MDCPLVIISVLCEGIDSTWDDVIEVDVVYCRAASDLKSGIVGEPLNHINQDTKSARLIAVCKRSFSNFRIEERTGRLNLK